MAERAPLERPWVRMRLVRELATGEHSQVDLAARHGVTQSAISRFASKHAELIADVAAKLDDQFAGLWAADKAARIAVLQQQVADIADTMGDPDAAAKAGVGAAEMHRVQQQALRAIADELGQIPARVQVQHSGQLDVRLNGVDVGALT
jgi:predicted transcriptional regulator